MIKVLTPQLTRLANAPKQRVMEMLCHSPRPLPSTCNYPLPVSRLALSNDFHCSQFYSLSGNPSPSFRISPEVSHLASSPRNLIQYP
jgi:hypothetical protein